MKLKEYQAKKLFKRYGIPIPKGKLITLRQFRFLCHSGLELDSRLRGNDRVELLAKAQVLAGGRGKRGLIKPATKTNLQRLFRHSDEILLEEKLKIKKEYYLALAVDREQKEMVVLFSPKGGIEIEKSSEIVKIPLSAILRKNPLPRKFLPLVRSMQRLMKNRQALLVEINPLALTDKGLVAADAKIILDDNALRLKEPPRDNFNYLPLKGNIAVVSNGAGLTMATLDAISYFGGRPANFLDLGGGASTERTEKALRLVSQTHPSLILVNIFGGITRGDQIARGLVNYKKKSRPGCPFFVRITGTNEKRARQILTKSKIKTYDSMEQVVKAAVAYGHSCQ